MRIKDFGIRRDFREVLRGKLMAVKIVLIAISDPVVVGLAPLITAAAFKPDRYEDGVSLRCCTIQKIGDRSGLQILDSLQLTNGLTARCVMLMG